MDCSRVGGSISAATAGWSRASQCRTSVGPSRVIRVGLIPSEDSRAMLASSEQLLESLEKNLGHESAGLRRRPTTTA